MSFSHLVDLSKPGEGEWHGHQWALLIGGEMSLEMWSKRKRSAFGDAHC